MCVNNDKTTERTQSLWHKKNNSSKQFCYLSNAK